MDLVYDNLIAALWVAWLAYWFIAARDVKATRRVESFASRASHILPLMLGAYLLWARRLPCGFLDEKIFPRSAILYFTAAAIVAAGLGFSIWARRYLGRNWSGTVTLKEGHELIRGGPYRCVRHPIYTGILAGFIGSALARDEWRGIVAVGAVYLALWRKLRIEEAWMIEQFGDAYGRYRSEVPALIPNPWRKKPS